MRAIREHARDFVAIIVLLILAIGVSSVILSNQRLALPSWVPVIGKDFFRFSADFSTGQAVTPGQGQTVNVAGVAVGEIDRVDLVDGRARVGLKLEDKSVIPFRDATLLLRPKTGLKDMSVELEPGSKGGRLPEGGTIPLAQTQPDVNLDEVLAALDDDTRTYLQALVQGAGEGLDGRGRDLGDTFRAIKPTASALRRLSSELAERKTNIRRVMHNFSLVSEELGDNDDELARFVASSNAALGTLAEQESNIRQTIAELPPALSSTRTALAKTGDLADELGPALSALRPAARELDDASRALQPFFSETTPVIRSEIRPLVREARPLVTELRPTFRDVARAAPDTTRSLQIVNRLVDMLAFNPPGDEEGYLFWFSWVSHLGSSLFSTQDAHGPVRRGLLVASCNTFGLLDNVAQVNPQLGTLIGLLNTPLQSGACPQQQGQAAVPGVTPPVTGIPDDGIVNPGDIVDTVTGALPGGGG